MRISLDARYCQNCGSPIRAAETPDKEKAQPKKEVDIESRLSILESKIEEIIQLISQNSTIFFKRSSSLSDRLIDYYPTYYVTFAGIIQSLVFGFLLLAILDQLSDFSKGTFDPLWIILIFAIFFFMISIWISYTRLVAVFQVTPQTLDGIIPFCFGLTQALVILSINLKELSWYYFSLTSIAVVGLIQWAHAFHQARLHYERNRILLEAFRNWDRRAKRMAVIRGPIFVAFGVSEALFHLHSLPLAFITLVMNALLLVFLHTSFKKLFKKLSEYS
jgi:hypothetical protein